MASVSSWSAWGEQAESSDRSGQERATRRIDYEPDGICEYTARLREAWPLLLRGPEAESLNPRELSSWLRLWGRLGAELYQCYRSGDAHIRADMIERARTLGGWRGSVVAERLASSRHLGR